MRGTSRTNAEPASQREIDFLAEVLVYVCVAVIIIAIAVAVLFFAVLTR